MQIKSKLLGFPRVLASNTRQNNSRKVHIHQIMPWIAFKNFQRVQVTYFDFKTLFFACELSFALGCSKLVVSKAEHLRKLSRLEARSKNLMGQVFEAQKFSLRKKKRMPKIEREEKRKFNS